MKALVGIIMGSDSDLPVMSEAAKILDKLSIPYELTIISAHRTPQRMYDYAQSAVEKGLKVIIAGAGGAAHLPGMTAALTPLPVIGVPVKTSTLSGVDSLYASWHTCCNCCYQWSTKCRFACCSNNRGISARGITKSC